LRKKKGVKIVRPGHSGGKERGILTKKRKETGREKEEPKKRPRPLQKKKEKKRSKEIFSRTGRFLVKSARGGGKGWVACPKKEKKRARS